MDVLLPSVKSIVYTIKKCWLSIVDRKKVLLVNLFYEDTSAHQQCFSLKIELFYSVAFLRDLVLSS